MKKYLLIIGLLCAPSAWAQCANTSYGNGVVCVQQAGVQVGAGVTVATATMGANTVSGHQVVVAAFFCSGAGVCNASPSAVVLTFTNGAGNTVTLPTTSCSTQQTFYRLCVGAFCNVSATTTFTATTGVTTNFISIYAAEFSGIPTSACLDTDATYGSAATGATLSVALTTTNTNLVYGYMVGISNAAVTPGAGFTEIGETVAGLEHEGKTAAGGSNPCTWSWTGNQINMGVCIGVKKAGASKLPLIGVGS